MCTVRSGVERCAVAPLSDERVLETAAHTDCITLEVNRGARIDDSVFFSRIEKEPWVVKKMKVWSDAGRGRGSVLLLCAALLTLSLSCAGVDAQVRTPTYLMIFTVEPHDILPHPPPRGAPSIYHHQRAEVRPMGKK